ncbi:unnamed protein product [Menidia menidia]|uniref:Glutathione S-transferase LANCL1 n=1 Tax=Menidia menidia TaxID=238744 RepID=A0A8S4B6V7_9TELE|nr:unnamed protein product [Menidia menidia]
MDTRALKNPYADYDGSPASTQAFFDCQGKLTPEFAHRLSSSVSELLAVMENGLKSADPRDCTTYTGWAGVALLYLHLHGVFQETAFLQKALEHVSRGLRCLTRRRDVTFLCGDAGPLAVAAVVYCRLQRFQEADECINRLMQYHQTVVKGAGELPDELLYGRAGYLYALVFINQQLGQDRIPLQYIQQISEAILMSGEQLSRKFRVQNQSPLMYEWYQEQYVGAAHGLAGIYYFLMQPGLVSTEEHVHRLVKPSVDHVCRLKLPTGNYPPLHRGRPGPAGALVPRLPGGHLHAAAGAFGIPQYLEDALHCGEVVWHWGLLKKGYGLCHGAAGNAYAFLALYRQTQEAKHLYRACMFADWCMNFGRHGCRTPDRPFSLFEGMAGTIYFLADLLQPMRSKFPAFEV